MAKHNPRVPLQVSLKFRDRLKDLQREVRKRTGEEISLREITDNMVSPDIFQEIEKRVLRSNIDIKIKFDERRY